MELADDNMYPCFSRSSLKSSSANISLTPLWASSKFPLMAETKVLLPLWVTIWSL